MKKDKVSKGTKVWVRDTVIYRMVMEGFTEKVAFEYRHKVVRE